MFNKILILLTSLWLILTLTACSPSTEDIAKEVRVNMAGQFSLNQQYRHLDIQIQNLVVTHVRDNEYNGILSVTERGIPRTYSVQIFHDGKTLQWQIRS